MFIHFRGARARGGKRDLEDAKATEPYAIDFESIFSIHKIYSFEERTHLMFYAQKYIWNLERMGTSYESLLFGYRWCIKSLSAMLD